MIVVMARRWLQVNDNDDGFHDDHNDKPWLDVLAASAIVQLATFAGILLSLCMGRQHALPSLSRLHQQIIPSFAAGTLVATAVFLLIPESMALLQASVLEDSHADDGVGDSDALREDDDHTRRFLQEEEHHEEEDTSYIWKFGSALIAGLLFPILLGALFPPPDVSQCPICQQNAERAELERLTATGPSDREEEADGTCCKGESMSGTACCQGESKCEDEHCCHGGKDIEDAEKKRTQVQQREKDSPTANASTPIFHSTNYPLAFSILLGDAFHNLTDGIFIGNAFLLCSRSVAYTIVVTTVYHELAQEVADFALLVHHCGLNRGVALLVNFIAGFSVLFGAVLILSMDLSEQATGIILAISAGVYVYISASECIPRIQANRRVTMDTLLFLFCFVLGAVPIGLVLLNHSHCDAHEDGHGR